MPTMLNNSKSIFRLLVPATDITPSDAPFVEFCNNRWVLAEFASISDAPPYTCISYSWGKGRTENMLEDGQLMSARTIPVIEAMIKASQSPEHWDKALKEAASLSEALEASQAIWIDALCVPSRDPARAACLRSMGAIYSSATQVFAVLSGSCSKLLRQIHNTGHIKPEEFFILETDDWNSRAWTYQEITNSRNTFFVAQGDGSVLIPELDLLSVILTDTTDYADAQGIDRKKLVVQFPRLDSLQELLAAHQLAAFTELSAYQAMSAMHKRESEREDDRIYAMIGVITNLPSDSPDDVSLHPAEYFMRLCEAKDEYSFIYSIAPRSEVPGRRWRPLAGQIPPVLSGLLASGSGQLGCLKATHLQMDNMCSMKPGILNSDGITAIGYFLESCNIGLSSPSDIIAGTILKQLRQKGFSGCGEYLVLENGYFFPQSSLKHSEDIFVVTSHDVLWLNGGPSLLLRSNGTDINQFCDVGVFIGRFPKVSESINVG